MWITLLVFRAWKRVSVFLGLVQGVQVGSCVVYIQYLIFSACSLSSYYISLSSIGCSIEWPNQSRTGFSSLEKYKYTNTELQIVAANVPAPVIVLAAAVAHLLLERFSSSPATCCSEEGCTVFLALRRALGRDIVREVSLWEKGYREHRLRAQTGCRAICCVCTAPWQVSAVISVMCAVTILVCLVQWLPVACSVWQWLLWDMVGTAPLISQTSGKLITWPVLYS